jgi:IS30 family transposase
MAQYTQLSIEERKRICTLIQHGRSNSEISKIMARNRSTIWREIRRNKKEPWHWYSSLHAHAMAKRRRKNRPLKSKFTPEIKYWIERKLGLQWSPEQIAGRASLEINFRISHEWIYSYVYRDRLRGGELYKNLRWGRRQRKKRNYRPRERTRYSRAKSIEIRPEIVNKRERIGDWEGDSIIGSDKRTSLVTMVERKTLLSRIYKVETRTAKETRLRIIQMFNDTPGEKHTITFDRGVEFSDWKWIELKTGVQVYFAHAYSAFERGTNENTNGLIRQYVPKKTDFKKLTHPEVKKIERRLNNRPRKKLGFLTPNEAYHGLKLNGRNTETCEEVAA